MKQFAAIVLLGLSSMSAQAQCGSPLPDPLIAHGSIPAGMVLIENDRVNLYVIFDTTGTDFTIGRADVAVATSLAGIPQSGGQPNLSAFPYRQTFSPEVTTYTFTIPLASIPASTGTTVVVAAHASLDSPTQGHQQAWAAGQLFPCSKACSTSGGCDGDSDDHGDHAHLRPGDGNGGGDECHGDGGDRASSGKHARIRIFDDGHGGTGQCGGGGGDDDGDSQKVSPFWGGGGDQNSCGGGGDHHGDHANLGSSPQDGGGDGGDHHHSDGGSDCQAGCGATYVTYLVQLCGPE